MGWYYLLLAGKRLYGIGVGKVFRQPETPLLLSPSLDWLVATRRGRSLVIGPACKALGFYVGPAIVAGRKFSRVLKVLSA